MRKRVKMLNLQRPVAGGLDLGLVMVVRHIFPISTPRSEVVDPLESPDRFHGASLNPRPVPGRRDSDTKEKRPPS